MIFYWNLKFTSKSLSCTISCKTYTFIVFFGHVYVLKFTHKVGKQTLVEFYVYTEETTFLGISSLIMTEISKIV